MHESDDRGLSRRDFLGAGVTAAAAVSLLPGTSLADEGPQADRMTGVPFAPRDVVRIGLIGIGGRGRSLLRDLLAIDGVRITALCDLVPAHAARGAEMVREAGQPTAPAVFDGSDSIWEQLVARDDLDIVYIATPWNWHVPMAVGAMRQGKHAAVEVPAATTVDDCWTLVNVSEKTRRHCIMLENCCYGYNEMLVLNLVKAGTLGRLTHGECAYIHDLRELLLSDEGEGLWRRYPHLQLDGNLYPTHGLGPVANYMAINRGDRFDYLVSMSSLEAGLTEYRDAHLAPADPKRQERYRTGDMNTSLIKTALGRTVMLQHDVVSPRPYSRINMISGTRGTFADYPPRIMIEGQPEGDAWAGLDGYTEAFESPLWKRMGEIARKLGGHGGMDFIMNYRLVQCLRDGLVPDMDVYDAAAWSAPGPLSVLSVTKGSKPVEVPDFTRGAWRTTRPVMG
ncbi:MAG TPA: Gfo/Idh/MocA family oxidoreductase [Gemmatimonadales bacterium]|nr:Gfo/Idh/MocA family oxidoreductase [Gemmatimonadales bacterium]